MASKAGMLCHHLLLARLCRVAQSIGKKKEKKKNKTLRVWFTNVVMRRSVYHVALAV